MENSRVQKFKQSMVFFHNVYEFGTGILMSSFKRTTFLFEKKISSVDNLFMENLVPLKNPCFLHQAPYQNQPLCWWQQHGQNQSKFNETLSFLPILIIKCLPKVYWFQWDIYENYVCQFSPFF